MFKMTFKLYLDVLRNFQREYGTSNLDFFLEFINSNLNFVYQIFVKINLFSCFVNIYIKALIA